MKSLVWVGPRQFELQEGDIPQLVDGESLLRVSYAGICGSELSGYLGTNSLRRPPLVMGHEFSGEIVSVCGESMSFQPGDLVTVNPLIACGFCKKCLRGQPQQCLQRDFLGITLDGAYAEYVKVPTRSMMRVGNAIAGALVEPLACSLRSVRQSGLSLGDNVVVFGAGIIGLFALKIAQLSGASQRILVDTNPTRLKFGEEFGATALVDPTQPNAMTQIDEYCAGQVHRVVDAVGAPVVRRQAVELVDEGGTVVFIGLHEDETTLPGNMLVRKEVSVIGSFSYDYDDFRRAHAILEDGVITYSKTWLDVRRLDEAQDAFEEQIFGPASYPKIILKPN